MGSLTRHICGRMADCRRTKDVRSAEIYLPEVSRKPLITEIEVCPDDMVLDGAKWCSMVLSHSSVQSGANVFHDSEIIESAGFVSWYEVFMLAHY